jgi:phosphatidylglycerophosphate synthase
VTAAPPSAPAKPREIEELVDEYFHRPLASYVVALLLHTPITPNQVTIFAGILGVASAIAVGAGAHQARWLLVGAALLLLSVIFDCADGQLARARKISSTTGAIVDGVADYIVGTSLAIGATYFLVAYYHNSWYWLLGLAGLVSTAVQSALFDHTKTAYAVRVGSGYSEREEDVQRITNERTRAWKEGRYREATLFWVYERYSKAQQVALHIRPVADPVGYRAANAGRMRTWTFLGIGTHLALGYLLGAAGYWWPPAIAGYFIICATLFNLLLVVLLWLEPGQGR